MPETVASIAEVPVPSQAARGQAAPILSVQDVCKSFGGLMAVKDMSLEVKPRTITGLIGPNAAGKTTLFNLISGQHRLDAGAIYSNGDRIDGLPPHKIFHKGICRTFQISRELKLMTVLENLMLVPPGQAGENLLFTWLRPRRVRAQERELREKALEVLRFVDLIDLKDEYASSLSAGQKRLLELARTMMADPRLILLDEPGAGVNPTLMKRLVEYIQQLAFERGVTIFLIEHDMDLVMNTCDPVIVMSSGEKLAEGPPEVIRRDPRVLEAYLGGQQR
jgi:branched-chain amino acid transport system ATP-binding protein